MDKKGLEFSFQSILERHEVLRSVIRERSGVGYQEVQSSKDFKINEISVAHLKEGEINDFITERFSTPFDLGTDYMMRVDLMERKDGSFILLFLVHHIASDGWSTGLLAREFGLYYESYVKKELLDLLPLEVQYSDYAIWQRNYLQGEVLESRLQYWIDNLKEVVPLELSTDYARPSVQSTNGSIYNFEIERDIYDGLLNMSKRSGGTLFITLLSAYKVLLYKYTGESNICVGTPIANRGQSEIAGLIGFFVNTLPLYSFVDGEKSFEEFLRLEKDSVLSAYEFQDAPFEKIVERFAEGRDQSRTSIFQTLFSLQNYETTDIASMNLGEFEIYNHEVTRAQFDLSFHIDEKREGLSIAVSYCTDLYKVSSIEKLCEHFKNLLSSILGILIYQIKHSGYFILVI